MMKHHSKPGQKPNRLITEKSPYLLQHAYNPVDWYPWCKEAFEKAKSENKPIFLSIGYSTCHWCHVMEKESFEDSEVAKLMNDTFVSIKVDREERPDIDNTYMTVSQAITGGGGWPLTIFMTPEQEPFFAGSYIPKKPRFNQTGLMQLIKNVNSLWSKQHDELLKSANQITVSLIEHSHFVGEIDLKETVLTFAYNQFARRFDERFGGFGGVPKFPSPHNLSLLLRYWQRTNDGDALRMVEKTLSAMRMGGIYDQVGLGFHRYSTDAEWLVPHFEKMLYDQAMLAIVYLEAYQATGNQDLKNTAAEIFTYVIRDMQSPGSGFYSAEDADSEGEEGKFYTWSEDELERTIGKEDFNLVKKIYNTESRGNFIDQLTGKRTKTNILHLTGTLSQLAREFKIPHEELRAKVEDIRNKLFMEREIRVHPHKDDKILTDWNGLMIAALAKGAAILDNEDYILAAETAMKFIIKELRTKDGRLLHRFRDSEAAVLGFLDDYAFLIWALLELFEATFNQRYLDLAVELNSDMLAHFWDDESGGLFLSPNDGEKLLIRQKEIYDGALPSGNSVAFLNLLRLSRLTNDPSLEEKASILMQTFSQSINQLPSAHTQFLIGLDFILGPTYEVVIKGSPDNLETKEMIVALRQNFLPRKVVLLNPKKMLKEDVFVLPDPSKQQEPVYDKTMVYVCVNYSCQKPTSSIDEMLKLLGRRN
jgi:uncharacterized protein YyaL (SSP411 family)